LYQIIPIIGQKPPEAVRFNNFDEFSELIKMIKQASVNFDDHGNPKPNLSHLFIKIHVWMDSRFQTLTIADIAGTCPSDSVYLNTPEINKTSNYIKNLLKVLNGSQK
jgi:hypothetical protein